MKCSYCETFRESDKRTFEMRGEKRVPMRYCPSIRKFVYGEDKSCDNFKMYHIIWCNKNSQWLQREVCINRQKEKFEKCHKCKQGKEVAELIRKEFFKQSKLKRRMQIRKHKKKLNRRNNG